MLAGQELKTLRNRRNITVREVEQASRRIADVKGDKRFCISNGWLAQLENGVSEPSICKLFSLSVIYRTNFLELVRLYNVDVNDKEKYEPVADPYITQLITNNEDEVISNASETSLIASSNGRDHILHAHLGLTDYTMYPMIRPGALLKIDPTQNKLVTNSWRNEYERPIYFIELRDAYACGWCELQGNQLLIIPHPSSQAGVRRFMYPREAEIVGRVIGYSTQCLDLEAKEVKPHKRRAMGRTNTT
ncbi:MAG TPA: helix-turn-helix transcriptional regulator [Pyrinomonadaceae bacterium]|nr:helix-turn-helix transcriptional regulator [Pyrinomonadaceae bacterium]